MLSELSTRIKHLHQLAAPLASTKSTQKESPPTPLPGLPATLTVVNPMEQALLRVMSNLGTSPAHQRTPTCPPSAEETKCAATLLVEQMAKVPGNAVSEAEARLTCDKLAVGKTKPPTTENEHYYNYAIPVLNMPVLILRVDSILWQM